KTWSACRLARGIAGPSGRVAVLDTEGGRTKRVAEDHFGFKAKVMDPPFRPERFAEAALAAETEGFDALLIDSFSMEWVG
ncbi:AAA family ATPase, partial [Pseudomonas aeruginosa]